MRNSVSCISIDCKCNCKHNIIIMFMISYIVALFDIDLSLGYAHAGSVKR